MLRETGGELWGKNDGQRNTSMILYSLGFLRSFQSVNQQHIGDIGIQVSIQGGALYCDK